LLTIQIGSGDEQSLSTFSPRGYQNINIDTQIQIYLKNNAKDLSNWEISWRIGDLVKDTKILPKSVTSKTSILSFSAPSPKNTKFYIKIAPTTSCSSCVKELKFQSK